MTVLKNIELSKRLHKATEFVVPDEPVLDIGSDHAYLPIYLVQKHIIPSAISGEIVAGPFQNALEKIKEYHLEDKISVRLGDGLDVLKETDNIGTVFICGMGGSLITKILKKGLENNSLPIDTRLVLQPNNAEENLRRFLAEANYTIIEEAILEENDKTYEIIVAEYRKEQVEYTQSEYLFGPILLNKRSEIFIKKWLNEKDKIEKILEELSHSENQEKIEYFKEKIQKIKQVIS